MDMNAFMKGKAKQLPEEEKIISQRYLDEEGKPIPFKLKAIPTPVVDAIRDDCTVVKHAKGQRIEKFDRDRFACKVAIATTIFPDFRNKELADSYGLVDPVEVAKAVLDLPGEYTEWIQSCFNLNGFDDTIEELVGEAKN